MHPDIKWITAAYGSVKHDSSHIAVPPEARSQLIQMASDLVGTPALLAIYVPKGTPDVYRPAGEEGRVVQAVRMLPMPTGRVMEDYFYNDLTDGSRRWPIGWPCRTIYGPPTAECPILGEHVESAHGPSTFANWAKQFVLKGPFELDDALRARLNSDFAQFAPMDS